MKTSPSASETAPGGSNESNNPPSRHTSPSPKISKSCKGSPKKGGDARVCRSCGTSDTPVWRYARTQIGHRREQLLCNACSLRESRKLARGAAKKPMPLQFPQQDFDSMEAHQIAMRRAWQYEEISPHTIPEYQNLPQGPDSDYYRAPASKAARTELYTDLRYRVQKYVIDERDRLLGSRSVNERPTQGYEPPALHFDGLNERSPSAMHSLAASYFRPENYSAPLWTPGSGGVRPWEFAFANCRSW